MGDTATKEKKPSLLEYFEGEKAKHVKAAEEIVTKAEKEVRGLTEEEREEVKHHTTEAHAFNAKIKDERDNRQLADNIAALSASMSTEPERMTAGRPRTLGEMFVRSESYRALQTRGTSGQFATGPIEIPAFGAVSGTVSEDAGDNGDMLIPQRIPGIVTPAEPALGLTDLFGTGVISRGNSVLLVRETVTTNAAATVAERGAKPPSNIQFATETATLGKIATVIKVSNEMLEDEDAMRTYLDGRLAMFVRQEREDQFATQLLSQAGQVGDMTDVGGDNLFDAILAGSVVVKREGGLDADAVAMTMLDWATLLAEKDDDGRYFSGGPFAGTDQRLWGRYRIAIVERLGDGNIVVGAFAQGGTIWRKAGGVTVEATNSNEDDFLNNLVAIRAEERATLFLQRPDAFAVVGSS
jgi:HK97 family phage major capsid protein